MSTAKQKKKAEANKVALRTMASEGENKRCMDCTRSNPNYVVTNFSTFVCEQCSGVHRDQQHHVKGIGLSEFSEEEMTNLRKGGNAVATSIWRPNLDKAEYPKPGETMKIKTFILNTYEVKRWYKQGGQEPTPAAPAAVHVPTPAPSHPAPASDTPHLSHGQWQCTRCTLINNSSDRTCNVCEAPKGPAAAPQRTPPTTTLATPPTASQNLFSAAAPAPAPAPTRAPANPDLFAAAPPAQQQQQPKQEQNLFASNDLFSQPPAQQQQQQQPDLFAQPTQPKPSPKDELDDMFAPAVVAAANTAAPQQQHAQELPKQKKLDMDDLFGAPTPAPVQNMGRGYSGQGMGMQNMQQGMGAQGNVGMGQQGMGMQSMGQQGVGMQGQGMGMQGQGMQGMGMQNQGMGQQGQGMGMQNQGMQGQGMGMQNQGMQGQGMGMQNQGMQGQGIGMQNQGMGMQGQGMGMQNQGMQGQGMGMQGQGMQNQGMGMQSQGMGMGMQGQGMGMQGQGMGMQGQGMQNQGMQGQGMGMQNQGMGIGQQGMGMQNQGMGMQNQGMGMQQGMQQQQPGTNPFSAPPSADDPFASLGVNFGAPQPPKAAAQQNVFAGLDM